MKLPPLTAERAVGPSLENYHGTGKVRGHRTSIRTSIRPQASTSCLTAAVGNEDLAIACSIQCGSDLDCWQECAGIDSTTALAACFQS
jgi:hypothetical protein